MVNRTYLNEYRHVPKIMRYGFLKLRKRVVLVLEQRYHDKGFKLPKDNRYFYDEGIQMVDEHGWCEVNHLNFEGGRLHGDA